MANGTPKENFKLLKQGAEAKLYLGHFLGRETIVKERFTKSYRHPSLDERLTKERMRAELRGLIRATSAGIHTPAVYFVHSPTNSIYMEYVKGAKTVNEYITSIVQSTKNEEEQQERLKLSAQQIGTSIGALHKAGIIHGDLTTSNILLKPTVRTTPSDQSILPPTFDVYLIDFGLSHVDTSAEDKGVDLYVLERALTSTHSKLTWYFELVLESYMLEYQVGGKEVYTKLEEIRLRGRKRTMIG